MKTPEQLKGAIRNIAKEKDLHAQEVLQIFMFERILERLSLSPYKKNFVIQSKGKDLRLTNFLPEYFDHK